METTKPTPAQSAELILKFYDLRREEKMREARNWIWNFKPETFEDFKATLAGPDSAKLRMILSYWDMGASLVNHGAIDEAMYNDTNGEYVFVFLKIQPFLADIRKEMPHYARNLAPLAERHPIVMAKAKH